MKIDIDININIKWRECWISNAFQDAGVYRICPQPLAGRWGRKTHLEDYILRLPPGPLAKVLREILMKRDYFRVQLEEMLVDADARVHELEAEIAEVQAQAENINVKTYNKNKPTYKH